MQFNAKNWRRLALTGKARFVIITFAALIIVGGIATTHFFTSQSPVQDSSETIATQFAGRYISYYIFALLVLITGAVYSLSIINKRQKTSDVTQEQLRILSMAVEQSPSTVMIVDTEGKIEYTNPKFTQLTGYTLDEVRGKNPSILKSGETSGNEYDQLWEIIKKGNTWRGTFHNRKKNGEYYWEAASISAIHSSSGEITHYLAVKEDITERVLLEEKFKLFVEAAPNGIIIINQKGEIELVNSEAESYFGYRRQKLIGKPIETLIPERFGDKHIKDRQAFFDINSIRKLGHNLNLLGKRKDGSEFPLEICLSPIETRDGKFVLASMTDISERLQLEKELAVRDREIARSQALAVVGRMANMVAHDLRNPLSSIKMTLQIFNQKSPKDWNADELELNRIALEQVQYMEGIMTDLLSYSRPEKLNLEWLNLDKLINHTVLLSEKQLDEHQVKVNTWFQTGLPTMNGDKDKLRQVFSNLITNAIQATDSNTDQAGEIFINTQLQLGEDHPVIRVEISDNGCGIDPQQTAKCFEPFFTTRAKGTGLGLAIVKRIIDQHHGTIHLEPANGGGTCAVVILPTAAAGAAYPSNIDEESRVKPKEPLINS